jgi:plastocyanin
MDCNSELARALVDTTGAAPAEAGSGRVSRRGFLAQLGLGTLGIVGSDVLGVGLEAQQGKREGLASQTGLLIVARRNYLQGRFYFDPVGLYIEPGQTVRWENTDWGFNVAAFHPDIGNRELRIPEGAKPFDSGLMVEGASFEWTFQVEGTYDYCSRFHETLGCVGRIVVGKPGGPGEKPPGYGGRDGRAPMFKDSARVFALVSAREIVEKKRVPFPLEAMKHPFPNRP